MMQFTDPSQNFIQRHPRPLDSIFKPKTVALIGAKDDVGTVGRTILTNLLASSFSGEVFPVNPHRKEVMGVRCYPDLASIPSSIDLAIIVTPARTVPQVLTECVKKKVGGCIIISAGFKELGPKGLELEQEIVKIAQKVKMPIIGPNCLGIMNPLYGLNATFAKGMALPGNLAFISQSGAMCTSVLDWSFDQKIGFSSFVSIGSMADVDWGDLIDYIGGDPATHSILMYMETIGNPRKFLSAAREIAIEKPIIVLKAGRSNQAAQAAASHTGSLAGSDEVFDAALERVGVLRVDTIGELFQMASVLSRQPKPKGPKLSIVTNAGGPGVIATDATVLHGAELAKVDGKVLEELNQILPAAWSHGNPIDILGDAEPPRFVNTLKILEKDQDSDGILVILSPQDMTEPTTTAEMIAKHAQIKEKPLLASWMGGSTVKKGSEVLNQANIPTFPYPDDAAKTFATMWQYSKNIETLYETPTKAPQEALSIPLKKSAQEILRTAEKALLDEYQSKKVVEGYGIPVVRTEIAITEDEAVALADKIGYPIVLKLYSHTITHKSDVGGVKLNLKDKDAVRKAYQEIQGAVKKSDFQGVTVQPMIGREGIELILGSVVDPQFGPTILFGLGGKWVEIFKDHAIGLPPLSQKLAKSLMEKTKVFEALKGARGDKSVDMDALENILVKFSQMIAENPEIKECDINPLLASPNSLVALDARIVLFEKGEALPKLAIRPYPSEYIEEVTLKNQLKVTLRPIRPEDETLLIPFHKELSEHSVRQRFFDFVSLDQRTSHERLMRICFTDFDREIAVVAESQKQILGVIRISRIPLTQDGQLTMIIRDDYHQIGLGTVLMEKALKIAQLEKISTLYAAILDENVGMIKLCKNFQFTITPSDQPRILEAKKIL